MLANQVEFDNGSKGYYTLLCPSCSYAIGVSKATQGFSCCPLCLRGGRKSPLEDWLVISSPEPRLRRVTP
jgi:hypothetical protein